MRLIFIYFNALVCSMGTLDAARILGIFPMAAKSHFSVNHAILKSLHTAGHHITMITPFPSKTKVENFTYIDSRFDTFILIGQSTIESVHSISLPNLLDFILKIDLQYCYDVMKLKEIQEAIQAPERKYDIILTEILQTHDCYRPIAEKLGIPVIGTVTLNTVKTADYIVGMPSNPAVIPHKSADVPVDMKYLDRIRNIWVYSMYDYYKENSRVAVQEFYQKYFPKNLLHKKDISLIFYNNHPAILPRSIPPNAIEVGGIHLQHAKPLPKDIQTFIENASHGVILFTFGSVVKANSLSPEQKKAFLAAFASIPLRVIWKYEELIENIPGNIMLKAWLPQRDILEHTNVIAFMSHCGQSGIYEAIVTGTPVVTIPIFADQPSNAAYLHWRKVGVNLDLDTLTKESVLTALNTIINDTGYHERMQELSRVFRDRPMTPQESVVYWTEYVIRHNGAPHLKALGADMPLYKYFMLDILALALIVLSAVIMFGFVIFREIIACVTKKRNRKDKNKKER